MRIDINLGSSASIDSAIKQIRDMARRLDACKLTQTLVERGAEQSRQLAPTDTGTLREGITASMEGERGKWETTTPYAGYVEFGTGVVGERSPYALASEMGWIYDVNQHGDAGWYYPDPDGKLTINGKQYSWTKGQKPSAFMLNSAIMLKDDIPAIAKEVFGLD